MLNIDNIWIDGRGNKVAPKTKFITDFIPMPLKEFIFHWVRDGMEQDPEELIKMLGAIITRGNEENFLLRILET